MNNVSDYDQFSYDYSQYWEKRRYEHLSEKYLLDKLFKGKSGNWFLDIGGSYGRLASTYVKNYRNPVILDYSAKTLRKNYEVLQNKYPNIHLIAANAYKMPFKENVFDGGLLVRVLHHIENPAEYFKELKRIMKNGSQYIQEFANKMHIKARIRALLKGDKDFFTKEPYAQPSIAITEGTEDDVEGIFYNFHPAYMREIMIKNGFIIKKKRGCSFLRSPFFKKIFNDNIMLFFEKIFQNTLFFSNIPPSIVFEAELKKAKSKAVEYENLEDILACPNCKGDLKIDEDTAKCKKCKKEYKKKDNVWDFRA